MQPFPQQRETARKKIIARVNGKRNSKSIISATTNAIFYFFGVETIVEERRHYFGIRDRIILAQIITNFHQSNRSKQLVKKRIDRFWLYVTMFRNATPEKAIAFTQFIVSLSCCWPLPSTATKLQTRCFKIIRSLLFLNSLLLFFPLLYFVYVNRNDNTTFCKAMSLSLAVVQVPLLSSFCITQYDRFQVRPYPRLSPSLNLISSLIVVTCCSDWSKRWSFAARTQTRTRGKFFKDTRRATPLSTVFPQFGFTGALLSLLWGHFSYPIRSQLTRNIHFPFTSSPWEA